ncbi:hypothetical protein ABW20_dc0107832 [Dactylellina cionopaga]|nr:hypothetical protein ABW20_dc0107832 [Dactylellina cionopaga]
MKFNAPFLALMALSAVPAVIAYGVGDRNTCKPVTKTVTQQPKVITKTITKITTQVSTEQITVTVTARRGYHGEDQPTEVEPVEDDPVEDDPVEDDPTQEDDPEDPVVTAKPDLFTACKPSATVVLTRSCPNKICPANKKCKVMAIADMVYNSCTCKGKKPITTTVFSPTLCPGDCECYTQTGWSPTGGNCATKTAPINAHNS